MGGHEGQDLLKAPDGRPHNPQWNNIPTMGAHGRTTLSGGHIRIRSQIGLEGSYQQQNGNFINKLKPEYEQVRNVARVRTITVLTQLDARRIGYVFAFLRETGLMSSESESIVNLKDADLEKINFSQAKLHFANLSGANLQGASLLGANLSNGELTGANLSQANLVQAYLIGAYLMDANLSGTFLGRTDLRLADLRGANLEGAFDITENQLIAVEHLEKQARWIKGATMSDGSIHP